MKKYILFLIISLASLFLLSSCVTLYRAFEFPENPGPYAVGSLALEITSEIRDEVYALLAPKKRRFMAQLWYPASKASTEQMEALLYDKAMEEALLELGGDRLKGFDYLHKIPTHSYADAKLSENQLRYPLLVFSPGNKSSRFQSLVQVEYLVSLGYIVLGVDHPYTSGAVIFPDGSIIKASDRLNGLFDSQQYTVAQELEIRVQDLREALNYVLALDENPASQFYGRIDSGRLGAFGHSLGGATVLQWASEDERVKAVFSEEGGVWGSVCDTGITVPFMYMQASKTLEAAADAKSDTDGGISSPAFIRDFQTSLNKVLEHSTGDFYYALVKGFNHFSFSDAPLYSDLFSGSIPYGYSLDLVNAYLSGFFNYYLGNESSALLESNPNPASKRFPEVELKKNPSKLF